MAVIAQTLSWLRAAGEAGYRRQLWLGLILAHLYALGVFGATFWVDSVPYTSLGEVILSPSGLRQFYDYVGVLAYSHYSPGEPLLWACLKVLPLALRWPVLALLQHGLAVIASGWLFLTAYRIWPSRWHLLGAGLLSLHPFYQSLHNALLSESVSSSMLMLGVALALRLVFLGWHAPAYLGLLLSMAVATQFRSYYGVIIAALGAIAWWENRRPARWSFIAISAAVSIVAVAWFPAYRYLAIGQWFTPGAGTNLLVLSKWTVPSPSPQLMDELRALGTIPEETLQKFFTAEFSYDQAAALGRRWMEQGDSTQQVAAKVKQIVHTVRRHVPGEWLLRLRTGLSSSGFSVLGFAGPDAGAIYQELTLSQQRAARLKIYYWQSWVAKWTYRGEAGWALRGYRTALFNSAWAQTQIYQAVRPYCTNLPPFLRDPFMLGKLYPDVFAVAGLLGLGVIFRHAWRVGLILLIPQLFNFALMAAVTLGGPRYAHGMLPLQLFSLSLALVLWRQRLRAADPATPATLGPVL